MSVRCRRTSPSTSGNATHTNAVTPIFPQSIEALEEMAFDKEGTKEDVRKAAYRALRRAKRIADKKEATP